MGGPPEPNLYRVVNICAGNDPDTLSQSAATIMEILDFLVVEISAINTSRQTGANPCVFPQVIAASRMTTREGGQNPRRHSGPGLVINQSAGVDKTVPEFLRFRPVNQMQSLLVS